MVKPLAIVLFLAAVLQFSCQPEPTRQAPFHFYFVGHAYGNALAPKPMGFWPRFRAAVDTINRDTLAQFLVFGGDMVKKAQESYFDAFDADRNAIPLPHYFVPGNHDLHWDPLGGPFDLRYAQQPGIRYQHFAYFHNHFFILDPHLAGWNIEGEQLKWLKEELSRCEDADNLFFFSHELLWWEKDSLSEWHLPKPNSDFARLDTINFWGEIVPLLESTGKPCFWLAGDIGADCSRPDRFFAEVSPHLHFVASGMGCPIESSFLQICVSGPDSVQFIAVGIGEKNAGRKDTLSLKDRHPIILRPNP